MDDDHTPDDAGDAGAAPVGEAPTASPPPTGPAAPLLPVRVEHGRDLVEVTEEGVTTRNGLVPWGEIDRFDAVTDGLHPAKPRMLRMVDSRGRSTWLPFDDGLDPAMAHWLPAELVRRNPAAATRQPIGLEILPSRTPWATRVLVFVTIAVTAWEFATYGTSPSTAELARAGGSSIGAIARGEWWKLGASNLLHANLLHIGLNMWVTLLLGSVIERRFGARPIAAITMAAALCAGIGSVVIGSGAVSIGESGIGFGLMAFAFVVDPRMKTEVGSVGGQTLVLNLVGTFAIPGISIGGHLGGAVGGALVGLVWLARPGIVASVAAIVVPTVLAAALWSLPQLDRPLADRIAKRVVPPVLAKQIRSGLSVNGRGVKVTSSSCRDAGNAPDAWSCRVTTPSETPASSTFEVAFDAEDQWHSR